VHVPVRSKLGQHGGRQVGARRDVPGGKALVQAILRDPRAIDQAAGSHDRPVNILAGGEEGFHAQHILVQRTTDDITLEGQHDAILEEAAHLRQRLVQVGAYHYQAGTDDYQAATVVAGAHPRDDRFGGDRLQADLVA